MVAQIRARCGIWLKPGCSKARRSVGRGDVKEVARRMEFTAWTRPDQSTLQLWAIARRLEALTKEAKQCTAGKNHQRAAGSFKPARVYAKATSSRQHLHRALQREIKTLRDSARRCIAGDAGLQRRYGLPVHHAGNREIQTAPCRGWREVGAAAGRPRCAHNGWPTQGWILANTAREIR